MALASPTYTTQAVDALTASGTPVNLAAFIQLHTASTSTTGANEMGSVTRQAMTWNAGSSGSKTNSGTASFTTPNTNAATHIGTFSAVSAGTFGIGLVLSGSVQAATITVAAGALTVSAA